MEHDVLSRHHFATRSEARAVVVAWCLDFYNHRRRHSSAGLQSPDHYEKTTAEQPRHNRLQTVSVEDPETGTGFAYAMNRLGFHFLNDPRELALRHTLFHDILGARPQK